MIRTSDLPSEGSSGVIWSSPAASSRTTTARREDAGGLQRERSLPHPGHPLDDADLSSVPLVRGESCEFGRTADELHRRRRQGIRRRDLSGARDRWRDGEFGVTGQDPLLQAGQCRPGFGALVLDETVAGFPVQA